MAASTKRRRTRTIAISVVGLALAGGAAAAVALRNPKPTTALATPSIFKTAEVTTGDLTTTEKIDGIVQLSTTLPVLHRIEGQTSSSAGATSTPTSTSAAATTPTSNPAAAANSATNPAALSSPLIAPDCSSTTVPATSPEPTTTTPPPDTAPDTTAPDGSTPDTTPAATTATTTVPAPDDTCDATATSTPAPGDTTDAAGAATTTGRGSGGARTGSGGGASRSAGGTNSSNASTARVTQTITSIIAANTAIHQGDVLYTVDGAPVVALDGALPAWRSLSTSSDDGTDIAQLEASLVALGYDPAHKVSVDNHFDSATRTMVKAWQRGLGIEQTGTVPLGSVVFLPTATTVSAVDQAVGDTVGDGDTVLTLAAPTQQVVVDVPAGDESKVVPGLAVQIGDVQGTVTRLRSADQSGAVVVEALIAPVTPIGNATNGTAVKVTLTLQNDAGVLIAPAEALVSRLDGTYAVEVKAADGTTTWLTVDLLGVSGGNVALRGDGLTEGTTLLLPV